MKRLLFIILLISGKMMPQVIGRIYQDLQTMSGPNLVQHIPWHFVEDEQLYVNGGITFTFPAATFSAAPNIRISVQLQNLSYSPTTTITPIITSNSALSATIRVNLNNNGVISEANTNDVLVHLVAVGSIPTALGVIP
jgi:hypothetical protein